MTSPLQATTDANPSADPPTTTTTTTTTTDDTPAGIMSKTKHKQTYWEAPLVISPVATHTHTIILLHGRGGNAKEFGPFLLFASPTSSDFPMPALFPGVKWVFPTSKNRRAAVLKRVPIAQWFDNWSLDDPELKQELQYEGIADTSAFVAGLIEEEARALGGRADRVVVGGLSQGCAAGLHVFLNWKGEGEQALGGFIGMSGWLPFSGALDPQGGGGGEEEEGGDAGDDPFGAPGEEGGKQAGETGTPRTHLEKIQLRAANTARDIASLPPLSGEQGDAPVFPRTPVFLGHGRHDEKVSVKLGERARDVLEALGCKVQWRDYDIGHWYKVPEEIDDIVNFLAEDVGIGQDDD